MFRKYKIRQNNFYWINWLFFSSKYGHYTQFNDHCSNSFHLYNFIFSYNKMINLILILILLTEFAFAILIMVVVLLFAIFLSIKKIILILIYLNFMLIRHSTAEMACISRKSHCEMHSIECDAVWSAIRSHRMPVAMNWSLRVAWIRLYTN